MTVKELITKLEEIDPDLYVFVQGYEGGYDFASPGHEIDVVLNWHNEWYYGKHENVEIAKASNEGKELKTVRGIVL